MLALPVPLIVSMILSYLGIRATLRGRVHPGLLSLMALCAFQGVIIALVQYYGISNIRWIQPLSASLIPPLCWLVFISTSRRPVSLKQDCIHVVAFLLCVISLLFLPAALDIVVPLTFIFYGWKLMSAIAGGGDSLPNMRLESGELPARLWQAIGMALLASALCDALIVLSQILGETTWTPMIVSLFTALNLLALGVLSLSDELTTVESPDDAIDDLPQIDTHESRSETRQNTTAETNGAAVMNSEEAAHDSLIVQQLDALMRDQQLYLDADLTLSRLARRLSIPAKQLSAAINRHCSENVSRHVNRYRIEHACTLMLEGRSITQSVYDSGFNTRSNFNREFQRIQQASPTEWLAVQT